MTKKDSSKLTLLTPPPELITESADEFDRLHDALQDECKARGTMDKILITGIAHLFWDIRRYNRAKTSLINSAFVRALRNLLRQVLRRSGGSAVHIEIEAEQLAHQYFSDEHAKKQILERLEYYKLDESAIEAEAMRISITELEKLDRLLASSEWRLNRALRCLAKWRGGLGRKLRAGGERIIDGEVLALDDASKKTPPASA
jgi:hypothetical protein